jgi:hypothetical protein
MNDLIPTIATVGHRHYAVEFDSIGHAIKLARSTGVARYAGSARVVDSVIKKQQGKVWVNYATFAKIDEWMVKPQPGLVAAVEDMKRRIEDVVQAPVRERRKLRRNREDGDELDPQAVLERRADGWTEVQHTAVPKHTVTIGVNLTVSSFCKPHHLLYRGSAAAALADLLTQSGHSVEVFGFVAVRHPGGGVDDLFMKVPLKRADMPMDLTSLAVGAAEIGFFRMIMMPNIGRVIPGHVDWGFGSPRSMRREELTDVDVCMDANLFDEESAVQAVKTAMAKIESARKEVA